MTDGKGTPVKEALEETRRWHVLLIAVVPAVLVATFQLPLSVREQLVLASSDPTVVSAYTAYFVHLQEFHLAGNLLVYALVVPVTYLLAVLSGRRQLFVSGFLTFLLAFPFALTALQVIFPRERLLFGFSGINAAFFGMLCFIVVSYAQTTFPSSITERDAPALLFGTLAVISLVSLPSRAYPIEIALAASSIAIVYVTAAVARDGVPTLSRIRTETKRGGYVELGSIGLGLLVLYPFIGFRAVFVQGGGVYDVYVHLVGYCLGFLVVYVSVVTEPGLDIPFVSESLSK